MALLPKGGRGRGPGRRKVGPGQRRPRTDWIDRLMNDMEKLRPR